MRALASLAALYVLVACDPATLGGIAVTPTSRAISAETRDTAVAVASRVALQVGLEHWSLDSSEAADFGSDCYRRNTLLVCTQPTSRSVEVHMREFPSAHWSPLADSLRHALLDSLRSRLSGVSVRFCNWRGAPGTRIPVADAKIPHSGLLPGIAGL